VFVFVFVCVSELAFVFVSVFVCLSELAKTICLLERERGRVRLGMMPVLVRGIQQAELQHDMHKELHRRSKRMNAHVLSLISGRGRVLLKSN
jgi:hypothetical protein